MRDFLGSPPTHWADTLWADFLGKAERLLNTQGEQCFEPRLHPLEDTRVGLSIVKSSGRRSDPRAEFGRRVNARLEVPVEHTVDYFQQD